MYDHKLNRRSIRTVHENNIDYKIFQLTGWENTWLMGGEHYAHSLKSFLKSIAFLSS